ncbi:MAG: GtrA family protein [Legionellaceae bacterium]|nr:GtrA family protein [Legionellaceae bacterium]
MKFCRYILIQLLAYVIDMGSFLLMLGFLAFHPVMANIIGKLAGGIFAFIAHRNITFKSNHKKDKAAQARRFFMLSMLNIPLSSLALIVLLSCVPYTILAKFMADVSCVFFNYWINKTFIFVSHRDHGS